MKYHSLDFVNLDTSTSLHSGTVFEWASQSMVKTQDQVHQIGVEIDLILKMTALDQGKETIPGNDPPLELVVSHLPAIGGN